MRKKIISAMLALCMAEPHQKFKELLPVEKRWPR